MKYILILIATILMSCENEASKYVRPTPTVQGSEAELDTITDYNIFTTFIRIDTCCCMI